LDTFGHFTPTLSAGEQPCEITWGEMFSVLPFGNRTVILTLTGAQLEQAFPNGVSPSCNPAIGTGRLPAISGLRLTYTCTALTMQLRGQVYNGQLLKAAP
jgi:2',3'-cyclic-nucleotide 2'-phosphodiesterase (5'-nucleotidase family)